MNQATPAPVELPELPELPMGRMFIGAQHDRPEQEFYTADQMRAYGEACRAEGIRADGWRLVAWHWEHELLGEGVDLDLNCARGHPDYTWTPLYAKAKPEAAP